MTHLGAENYIHGEEFLCLTESDVKAMVPPIGLARKVMRLLPTPKVIIWPTQCTPSFASMSNTSLVPSPFCISAHA